MTTRYRREGLPKIRISQLPHTLHNFGDTHAGAMAGAASARRLGMVSLHKFFLECASAARLSGHRSVVGDR